MDMVSVASSAFAPLQAAAGYSFAPGARAAGHSAHDEPAPKPVLNTSATSETAKSDVSADAAIRQAEAALSQDVVPGTNTGGDSEAARARAQAGIAAARALAEQGAYVAARLMAEQASTVAAPQTAGLVGADLAPGAEQPVETAAAKADKVYQDGSGDPNASMKAPTRMSPFEAAVAVQSHERGHIIHAESAAMSQGERVVMAYTVTHTGVNTDTGELITTGGHAVIKTQPKPEVELPLKGWTA